MRLVLKGVEHVEPGRPEEDGEPEQDRQSLEFPAHGDPGADGRDAEAEPSTRWESAVKRFVYA